MTTNVMDPPKIDALVERYIKLRDKKTELKAAYEKSVVDIDTAMERVEAYLQDQMNTLGVTSLRSSFGTAYQSERVSATVADWDSIFGWIKDNAQWAALEHRVSKKFVEDYKNEHNDIPPGINLTVARTVNIKRS